MADINILRLQECLYRWTGNVRELENLVERAVVMAKAAVVQVQDLPRAIRGSASPPGTGPHGQPLVSLAPGPSAPPEGSAHAAAPVHSRAEHLKGLEREELRRALESTGWVITRAGKVLGWTPRQVAYKMKKHGLSSPCKG